MSMFNPLHAVTSPVDIGFGASKMSCKQTLALLRSWLRLDRRKPIHSCNGEPTAVVWAHSHSDLKADPIVRFGNVPDGTPRYAILKNETPAGQGALRLRIGPMR
jgi:hypothetical protein